MAVNGIFFSYARTDSEFALKLAKNLRGLGVKLWIDQMDIPPGARWDHSVEAALRACDELLVILSPGAINSTNVMDEVAFALEKKKTIVPVLHRDCEIPFRLIRLQYIDMRGNYNISLNNLVSATASKDPEVKTRPNPVFRDENPPETSSGVLPLKKTKKEGANATFEVSSVRYPRLLAIGFGALIGVLLVFIIWIVGVFTGQGLNLELTGTLLLLVLLPMSVTGAITGLDQMLVKIVAVGWLVSALVGAVLFPMSPIITQGYTLGSIMVGFIAFGCLCIVPIAIGAWVWSMWRRVSQTGS